MFLLHRFTKKVALIAAIALIVMSSLIIAFSGCSTGSVSRTGKHNIGEAYVARWTADGRYLFTEEGARLKPGLFRYDTRTWERRSYDGLNFDQLDDVSPDGKQILSYNTVESIKLGSFYSVNLKSHRKTRIMPLMGRFNSVVDIKWVRRNVILFNGEVPAGSDEIYKLSVSDGKLTKLTSNYCGMFFPAADGSGFIYENDLDDKLHFYDLDTGRERAIVTKHLKYFRSYCYMYLSKDMLVYRKNTGPEHVAEILDLATLNVTRFNYCKPGEYLSAGVMSPAMNMYLPAGGSSHYGGDRYVIDLPRNAVKILKQKQTRGNNSREEL